MSFSTVYLSLGSNVSPEKNIKFALDQLCKIFGDVDSSSTYLTKAVGFKGSDFLNLVVRIDTALDPVELIAELHRIEEMTGRVTATKAFNDRTLDIDVLIYDEVINLDLNIPRDEILKYGFVLEPLAEICPDGIHPTENITFLELWNSLKENLEVSERI